MPALTYHPDRSALIAESHLRPFRTIDSPSQLSFVAFLRSPGEPSPMARLIAKLCQTYAVTPPEEQALHFSANFGLFDLRWERHTEFDSLQIFCQADPANTQHAFSATAFGLLPKAWVASLPATCFLSAHLDISSGPVPERDQVVAQARGLDTSAMVLSHLQDQRSTLMTDFRAHSDGFQRFLLINHAANAYELGRSVQRLVEIETYRALILLANPLVRAQSPMLSRLSQQLSALVRELDEGQREQGAKTDTARNLLSQALTIEAELGRLEADTSYRLSATRAYVPLVAERIARLKETRMAGWQRYSSFLLRRMAPAERAALNLAQRMTSVQDRAKRIVALLQTQISVQVEVQNQQLLSNMEANARKQLQLQRAVELIGAVAITYYAVSVFEVLLKPLHLGELAVWLKAASVPVFLVAALYLSQRLSGHLKRPLARGRLQVKAEPDKAGGIKQAGTKQARTPDCHPAFVSDDQAKHDLSHCL
jgi:uncharacterized membrane-anchored protein